MKKFFWQQCPVPTSTPAPTPSPTPSPLAAARVFVTSTTYNGNLGGLAGADAKCQARATAANLGGSWKAWLSDSGASVVSRFSHANVPYKLINGTVVANNWDDLIGGSLQNAITISELNKPANSGLVWTNTKTDGTQLNTGSNKACGNWWIGYYDSNAVGMMGNAWQTSNRWTNDQFGYNVTCQNMATLYCFEQDPNYIPTSTKRVFVTSTTYNGNLGGLSGADAKCEERAHSANLGGTWKAWLSDSKTSAASRLTHSSGPYQLLSTNFVPSGGTFIADNWADLTDGNLKPFAYIRVDENRKDWGAVNNYDPFAWTGTNEYGQMDRYNSDYCQDWTTTVDSNGQRVYSATVGSLNSVNWGWTSSPTGKQSCPATNRLYCFEQ